MDIHHAQSSLLDYLGITFYETLQRDKGGETQKALHVWVENPLSSWVQEWADDRSEMVQVEVFEGQRPPF